MFEAKLKRIKVYFAYRKWALPYTYNNYQLLLWKIKIKTSSSSGNFVLIKW